MGDRFWEDRRAADLQEGRLVTASHWRPLQNSVEEKNAALWPLGQGGGAGSCPLSRWERVGVRAGGGAGRASVFRPSMEPEAPVTQRPPLGETERGRAPAERESSPSRRGALVGARSPSLRPPPRPPRSCPPLPLGEGWGEGGETFAKLRRGEERRPLALGTRRRGVLPPLPLGEGWGEGGGRRGPRDLAGARPPSYANALAITRSAGS